jgi:hypothetical protein
MAILLDLAQAFPAIAGSDDTKTFHFEQILQRLPQVRVIFNYNDVLAWHPSLHFMSAALMFHGHRGWAGARGSGFLVQARTDRDVASQRPHDLVHQCQAQANAWQALVLHWLQPFERLKNTGGIRLVNSLPSRPMAVATDAAAVATLTSPSSR